MRYSEPMATKTQQAEGTHAGTMPERILDAAGALLEAEGLSALTIRRLASEAEVAAMSIYHHLGSKEGVIDLLLQRAFRRLELAMRELATHPDPLEAYREAGRRYRELALQAPVTYSLMFAGQGGACDASAETQLAALASLDGLVVLCQRLGDAGLVGDREAVELAQATWASVHGSVTLEIAGLAVGEAGHRYLCDLIEAGATASPR